MAIIIIKDLAENRELDSKALAKIAGGYYNYYSSYNYWNTYMNYNFSPVTTSIGNGLSSGIANGGWNNQRWLNGFNSSYDAAMANLRQWGIYL
ncbi:MAG TPA: hypothetical protein PK708_08520 [Candidatus Competibacter sp.]|nr:hypothetical protein [Candidatus Competibacter sp.]